MMKMKLLILLAIIAIASARRINDAKPPRLINRPKYPYSDRRPRSLNEEEPEAVAIVDTYPVDYIRDVPIQDLLLEPTIQDAELGSESRVRRSPKEPVSGKIVVQGGARKGSSTGGRTEGQIYVGGKIRFRRSLEDETQDSHVTKTLEATIDPVLTKEQRTIEQQVGQDSRLTKDIVIEDHVRSRRSPKKKGSGRLILRGEAGRGTGRKGDAAVHLIGEYRFRRSLERDELLQ